MSGGCGTIADRSWPWRSSSVVEQGTHKPLVASSTLASATNVRRQPMNETNRQLLRMAGRRHICGPRREAPDASVGASYPYYRCAPITDSAWARIGGGTVYSDRGWRTVVGRMTRRLLVER